MTEGVLSEWIMSGRDYVQGGLCPTTVNYSRCRLLDHHSVIFSLSTANAVSGRNSSVIFTDWVRVPLKLIFFCILSQMEDCIDPGGHETCH